MGQQLFMTGNLGGYLSTPSLSSKARQAAQTMQKFRQFTNVESAVGAGKNEKFLYDKISNIQTQGSTLTETSTIPKSNFLVRQGSLTIAEYGNSIPYTFKVEKLSQINVPENIRTVLKNDWSKVLDSAVKTQFVAAEIKAVIPTTATTTFTTDGTATVTATGNASDKNVRDIIDYMKTLNIPRRNDGKYVAVCSTNFIRGVYDFFEPKAQATDMAPLAAGEVGTYYGCRFVEETNTLSNILGGNTNSGEAVFFGDDAVHEGVVVPEEFRIGIPSDYGRDMGIAWYALLGFQRTWSYATDGEERIIHVTSA